MPSDSNATGTDRMSFDALIQKVKQAEVALEAQERQGAADWRQFKASWRAAWTPGRIVSVGLLSGFLIGRAKPLRAVTGGGALQMLGALSGLLASGSAQAAAEEAGNAADSAAANSTLANSAQAGSIADRPATGSAGATTAQPPAPPPRQHRRADVA